MRYCENELTYADYILLRSSVGWNNVEGDQMAQAVQKSLYTFVLAIFGSY